MKQIFTYLLLFLTFSACGQDCTCLAEFEWLKKTFEENDAGFSYALESKGEKAYAQHNAATIEALQGKLTDTECLQMLNEWLLFFRSGHIGIRPLAGDTGSGGQMSEESIIAQFKDWEKLVFDAVVTEQEVKAKQEADFAGIWQSGSYKIGIQKTAKGYVGSIIEADGVYWTSDQVKLRINEDQSAVYYMRDHSAEEFPKAELVDANHLVMGFITLERLNSPFPDNPKTARYFKSISAEAPYFELIDKQTAFLRIPSFSGSERDKINSVIEANYETITSVQNLIIDLRNNGGGSDSSFEKLLPLLYTNPIRTTGVELLSTELNNQRMLDFINNPDYGFTDEEKEWAQESYDKLAKRPGEFVNLDSTVVDIQTFDKVLPYPKEIGIIIHENNGSTTEQFLLAAKQSKKVKLYGTTTAGVLDISNMYFVPSPCKTFELAYSLSRSMRIPGMTIDDKGIQPDYYLGRDVKPYEWIEFVRQSMQQK